MNYVPQYKIHSFVPTCCPKYYLIMSNLLCNLCVRLPLQVILHQLKQQKSKNTIVLQTDNTDDGWSRD